MPDSLIGVEVNDAIKPCRVCALSDYIEIQKNGSGPILKVKSKLREEIEVFRLHDLTFSEFRSDIQMQLVTDRTLQPHRGRIIGLSDGFADSLIQPARGTHGFWNRAYVDPIDYVGGHAPTDELHSTHPFFAYEAFDTQVHGVFVNSAAAQGWYLNNDELKDY